MSEENEFFDDIIDDEIDDEFDPNDSTASEWEEETDVSVRAVLMAKNDLLALLGLKTSDDGGQIVRVDPRQSIPDAQQYEDAAAAANWFKRSLTTSKRNGWCVIYDGPPLFG